MRARRTRGGSTDVPARTQGHRGAREQGCDRREHRARSALVFTDTKLPSESGDGPARVDHQPSSLTAKLRPCVFLLLVPLADVRPDRPTATRIPPGQYRDSGVNLRPGQSVLRPTLISGVT